MGTCIAERETETSMRLCVTAVLALLAPVAVGAQPPTVGRPSAPARPIVETFTGFGYYGGWLLAAFDSIPASRYSYRPTAPQQSIGYIAQHLEDANTQLCTIIGGVKRPMTA